MAFVRRTLQVIAVILALLVGVTAMAAIVAQTTWFKERLRAFIVRQAADYVNGRLEIGRLAGNYWAVPYVEGLGAAPGSDALKHFGAAMASFGSIAMFHLGGITPEAEESKGAALPLARAVTQRDVADLHSAYAGEREIDVVVFSAPQLSLVRFSLGVLAFHVPLFVLLRRRGARLDRTEWWRLVLIGATGAGSSVLLFTIGLNYAPATYTSLISMIGPPLTALLAWLPACLDSSGPNQISLRYDLNAAEGWEAGASRSAGVSVGPAHSGGALCQEASRWSRATRVPELCTRPSAISFSAARLEATPACDRIF